MKFKDLNKFLILSLFAVACATSSKNQKVSPNTNLAPASMSPPEGEGSGEILDSVYMRSQADYHYTLGESLSLEGKSQRAVEEFRLTLVYDNQSVQVRMRLAAEYVRLGMMTEALEQAESVVEMAPNLVDGRVLLGGLYSSLKIYDRATEQYDAVLKLDPNNMEVPIYKAALLAEQRKYDESIAIFKRLSEAKDNPNRHQAFYYAGRITMEKGLDFYRQAIGYFTKAIALKPSWVDPIVALSQVYKAQDDFEANVKLLRSYQEKFGPHREIAKELSQLYLDKNDYDNALEQLEVVEGFERDNLNVKVRIALIQIEKKEYEKAASRLEEILKEAPDSDKIRFYLGAVYEEMGQKDRAVSHYKQVPSSSTYFADATIHAAFLLKSQGLSRSQDLVEEALSKRKDLPQLYAFYASILDERKEYSAALRMLTSAVEKFPSHAQLNFYLGTMLDRVGNTDRSIEQMKKVLNIEQDHVQALNFLAYSYAEQDRDLDEAESLARRALELQPKDGFIMDTVGWVLFKKGHYSEAVQYLERAYAEKSSESVIAEHLGDVYYRLQLVDKAKRMYKRAMEFETDEKKAREIRSKLAAVDHQQPGPLRIPASVPEQLPDSSDQNNGQ